MTLLENMAEADPVSTPIRGQRLPWIEHLRGLAALMVLVQHLLVEQVLPLQRVSGWFNFGLFGVVVFFLISGFVIPYSAFGLQGRPGLAFPIARVFRLYPAYWVSLAAGFFLLHPGWRLTLVNGTMAQRLVGRADVWGVYWTLEIEILFYVATEAMLLCGWLRREKLYPILAVACAVLAVAMGLARHVLGMRAPLAPPAGLAVMFLGTCWYLHTRRGLMRRRTMVGLGTVIYGLLCVSFVLGYSRDWGFGEQPLPFCTAYGVAGALFFALQGRSISSAVLTFFGRISYPLYLLHVPVMLMGAIWLHDSFWVDTGLELGAVVALSAAVHYGVENPCVRWGKMILARLPG